MFSLQNQVTNVIIQSTNTYWALFILWAQHKEKGRKSCPLEQKIKFYTCIESLHIFIYDMTYNQYRERKSPTIFEDTYWTIESSQLLCPTKPRLVTNVEISAFFKNSPCNQLPADQASTWPLTSTSQNLSAEKRMDKLAWELNLPLDAQKILSRVRQRDHTWISVPRDGPVHSLHFSALAQNSCRRTHLQVGPEILTTNQSSAVKWSWLLPARGWRIPLGALRRKVWKNWEIVQFYQGHCETLAVGSCQTSPYIPAALSITLVPHWKHAVS